jgi:hypothetical protein
VSDLAQLPGRDELFGVLQHRDVTIHKADHALHPGLFDGFRDVVGLSRDPPARLLKPDVLARPSGGDGDLAVEVVGRGDADGLDLRVLDDLSPVGGPVPVSESLDTIPGPLLDHVRRYHQPRLERAPGVVVEQAAVASGMHLAHPPQADQSYADLPSHVLLSPASRPVTGRFVSCSHPLLHAGPPCPTSPIQNRQVTTPPASSRTSKTPLGSSASRTL